MTAQPQHTAYEFWEKPTADEMYMIVGWRQWADAGSVSSGLPEYIVQKASARPIGRIRSDGFYLFQVPGTHDLVRPVVRFLDGFPETLEIQHNDFYYFKDGPRGIVVFAGDEPHMNVDHYIHTLLDAAASLNVKRIIGLGGVYGELPYDKERMISCNYSQRAMREELDLYAVNYSDYQGGASIGSVLCKRASERGMEYVGLYAFVPAYDFSIALQAGNTIRIENDFTAWLGVMKRINYMLKIRFDLRELEEKSESLRELVKTKLDELEQTAPQLGLADFLHRLSEEFQEPQFAPLEDVWEDELKRLLDKFEDDKPDGEEAS